MFREIKRKHQQRDPRVEVLFHVNVVKYIILILISTSRTIGANINLLCRLVVSVVINHFNGHSTYSKKKTQKLSKIDINIDWHQHYHWQPLTLSNIDKTLTFYGIVKKRFLLI